MTNIYRSIFIEGCLRKNRAHHKDAPYLSYTYVVVRTNERSRSPDGEAGLRSWDTYGKQP
mgnify:CR=1 FL=1